MDSYDCIIIGAGIIGTAIARELSCYHMKILLLEKGRDVAVGATKANSGIVHGGYTAKWGTLKGELSIKGNRMYAQLSRELGFPYTRTGSYVLALTEEDEETLRSLRENGRKNGVKELEIHSPAEVLSREPLVNPGLKGALHCGETGIVSPYEAAIAFAENAVENGTVLKLNHGVDGIDPLGEGCKVRAGDRSFQGRVVINAAGLYADQVAAMAGLATFRIRPRKGEYLLLRRGAAAGIRSVLFQTPTAKGKGVLVTPTTWNNLMIGPNAEEIRERENAGNSFEVLERVFRQARLSVPGLTLSSLIRIFSGVRASSDRKDFIIEEAAHPGFIQVGGIDSPGLTSAPAIARKVALLMEDKGYLGPRKDRFLSRRRAVTLPAPLQPMAQVKALIDREPGDSQRLVCRCEQVSEKTILDALDRGIPLDSLDAVKRRTRAGMGACQGAFCGPRVRELLKRHNHLEDGAIQGGAPKDQALLKKLKTL